MKVIATGFQQQRLVIDRVDPTTAGMTASVLNELEAQKFLEAGKRGEWFYQPVDDGYELVGKP